MRAPGADWVFCSADTNLENHSWRDKAPMAHTRLSSRNWLPVPVPTATHPLSRDGNPPGQPQESEGLASRWSQTLVGWEGFWAWNERTLDFIHTPSSTITRAGTVLMKHSINVSLPLGSRSPQVITINNLFSRKG